MCCVQQAAVDKWFSKKPSIVSFDDRLQFYHKTIDELSTGVQLHKDQDCVHLHMTPLAEAIRNHAKQWITCYGTVLFESSKKSLKALKEELEDKSDDLEMSPDSLEDLKFVLKTISDIKDMSLDVETRIRDLQERYRVMVMYNLMVSVLE